MCLILCPQGGPGYGAQLVAGCWNVLQLVQQMGISSGSCKDPAGPLLPARASSESMPVRFGGGAVLRILCNSNMQRGSGIWKRVDGIATGGKPWTTLKGVGGYKGP